MDVTIRLGCRCEGDCNCKDTPSYKNVLLPWNRPELENWTIVGMNHYHVKGVRHLYCAMVCNDMCISYEGINEAEVFEVLAKRAELMEQAL